MSAVLRQDQSRAAAFAYDNASPDETPSIYEDYDAVATILGDAGVGQDWLVDAIAYYLCNSSDRDYLTREIERHCKPIVEARS